MEETGGILLACFEAMPWGFRATGTLAWEPWMIGACTVRVKELLAASLGAGNKGKDLAVGWTSLPSLVTD